MGEPTKTFQLLDSIERSLAHETRWERLKEHIHKIQDPKRLLLQLITEIEEDIPVAATEAEGEGEADGPRGGVEQ